MSTELVVQIVNRFALDGTIDGHNPLGVTFRILGPEGWFRITFITVNWGRGYKPGEFHDNVMNVLNKAGEKEYVILLIQELDEADEAPERKIFKAEMEPGTTLVEQWTREPIAVSPGIEVRRPTKTMTMDQGSAIGAPPMTGPRRFFVSCYILVHGVRIAVGNQHPHRNIHDPKVQAARRRGEIVTRREVTRLVSHSKMAVYGGDMNDVNYPKSHALEHTATEVGLDTIRYVVA